MFIIFICCLAFLSTRKLVHYEHYIPLRDIFPRTKKKNTNEIACSVLPSLISQVSTGLYYCSYAHDNNFSDH
jgi:hypothetical protein